MTGAFRYLPLTRRHSDRPLRVGINPSDATPMPFDRGWPVAAVGWPHRLDIRMSRREETAFARIPYPSGDGTSR